MRISDWSSDVCSSDLESAREREGQRTHDERGLIEPPEDEVQQHENNQERRGDDELQPVERAAEIFELSRIGNRYSRRQLEFPGDGGLQVADHRGKVAAKIGRAHV